MLTKLKSFERFIVTVVLALMVLAIFLATVHLVVLMGQDILFQEPRFLVGVNELLDLFGLFLIIILGLELMETIRAYLQEDSIHVEVVLLVAIIALARKVIILETKQLAWPDVLSLSALMLSLSASYWLVKNGRMIASPKPKRR